MITPPRAAKPTSNDDIEAQALVAYKVEDYRMALRLYLQAIAAGVNAGHSMEAVEKMVDHLWCPLQEQRKELKALGVSIPSGGRRP